MSNQDEIREQLSALMDGELSRDERAFLLRRIEHDQALKATWSRYHLMREVLSHRQAAAPFDLADRVMTEIKREREPVAQARVRSGGWRPVVGMALAASVALVAILAVRPTQMPSTAPALATDAPAPRVALPVGVPGPIAALSDQGIGAQPVSAERSLVLGPATAPMDPNRALLLRHGQAMEAYGNLGTSPYVHALTVPAVWPASEIPAVEAVVEGQ